MAAASCNAPPQAIESEVRDRPASLLTLVERKASPLSREFMVGYWAFNGQCRSDLETALWPNGTYTMGDGRGRWALVGDVLRKNVERMPSISYMQMRLGDADPATLRKVGPDEIAVDWGNGFETGGTFTRCS